MDSWVLNCSEGNMINSQRRGLDLDLDLNYPLAPQMRDLDLSLRLSVHPNSQEVQTQMHGWSHRQTTNAMGVLNDQVTVIPPRTLSQDRENSERDNSHAMTNLCTNCERRMSDERDRLKPGTSNKRKASNVSEIQKSQSVPMPDESTLSCPICISSFVEPTATKCGHIFCKECLLKSLKSLHNKCPTCRQKVGKRSIIRIYLPTNN